jgi:hypothetical protein
MPELALQQRVHGRLRPQAILSITQLTLARRGSALRVSAVVCRIALS